MKLKHLILPIISTIFLFNQSLMFNTLNPKWYQYLTSAYVHANLTHYLINMVTYLALIFILSKKLPKSFYLFSLLIYPILEKLILTYPKTLISGASGIISVFFGYFLFSWDKFNKKHIIPLIIITASFIHYFIIFEENVMVQSHYFGLTMGIIFCLLIKK
jgi:rhomboid protease GluP